MYVVNVGKCIWPITPGAPVNVYRHCIPDIYNRFENIRQDLSPEVGDILREELHNETL